MPFLIAITSICHRFWTTHEPLRTRELHSSTTTKDLEHDGLMKNYMFPDQHMLIREIHCFCCLEVKMKFDCKLSNMVGDTSSMPQKSLKIPFLPQEFTMK